MAPYRKRDGKQVNKDKTFTRSPPTLNQPPSPAPFLESLSGLHLAPRPTLRPTPSPMRGLSPRASNQENKENQTPTPLPVPSPELFQLKLPTPQQAVLSKEDEELLALQIRELPSPPSSPPHMAGPKRSGKGRGKSKGRRGKDALSPPSSPDNLTRLWNMYYELFPSSPTSSRPTVKVNAEANAEVNDAEADAKPASNAATGSIVKRKTSE